MLNSPMQIDKKEFQELLKEIQMYNKLDLVAQTIQTKYAREAAGEDDDARRKDAAKSNELLEKILVAISGTKSKSDAAISKQGDKDKSFSLKDDFKKFKEELKSGVAFGKRVAGSAIEAIKSPVQTLKKGAIGAASINEQIYQQAGDILSTPAEIDAPKLAAIAQPSAKQKIEEQSKTDNPNIIDEPNEVIAEESEKQTVVFNELLDVTKESLDQLKAIKISLEGRPEPLKKGESVSSPLAAAAAVGGVGGGILDQFGMPMLPEKIPSKPSAPDASKGGKGAGKAAAKGIGKSLLKKIPVVGAVAGLAFGASRLMQGDVAGAGMEVASGLAGTVPGVGTAASVGIDAALAAKDASAAGESSEGQMIAGEPYVPGQPLTDKQMAVIGMAKSMGNNYSPDVEEQYAKQSQKVEGRQTGGPITAGKPYMVGEKGPEVVVPTASAKVMPAQSRTIDLGGGESKKINPDGSYETRGAYGTRKYDKEGNLISEVSPRFAGYQRETSGGSTVESYQQGGFSASQTSQGGQVTAKSASQQVGQFVLEKSGENASIRDMGQPAAQPVVMNNVSNNAQTTYMPMKGEPRATHRGSALDQYSQRTATY
jgi:hypothetical protein